MKKPGLMIGIMGDKKKGDEDGYKEEEGQGEDYDEAISDASGAILDSIKAGDKEALSDALMDFVNICGM